MKLELTESEIDLIDKALTVWENEEITGAMFGSMMSVMLGGKEQTEEQVKRLTKERFDRAEEKSKSRKIAATMLKAKLYQAKHNDARATEFSEEVKENR